MFHFCHFKLSCCKTCSGEASFVAKISIVIEEADESAMWIELIMDKNLIPAEFFNESNRLLKEGFELTSIFIATRKTINLRNKRL